MQKQKINFKMITKIKFLTMISNFNQKDNYFPLKMSINNLINKK